MPVTDKLARFVTVGRNVVFTVAFDGTTLAVEDQAPLSGLTAEVEGRGVALARGGTVALAAWFEDDGATPNPSGWVGGELAVPRSMTPAT